MSEANLSSPSPTSATIGATSSRPLLLVVEDDAAMRQMCQDLFRKRQIDVEGADSSEQALQRVQRGVADEAPPISLVLSDVRLGRGHSGIDLLRELKKLDPELPILLMTGYATVADAVQAMKLGAADYVTKPFERAELISKVERQLKIRKLENENRTLRSNLKDRYDIPGLIGRSTPMRRLCELIQAAGTSSATVLITGESGTGKELVARAIHQKSARALQAFVPVNCAALPDNLIESELFGHEAGSFTGATREGQGLFRAADGGSVLLDEVADMPKDVQAKLLRVLQDRRVRPVGSTREKSIDVRVIAATNWDVDRARIEGALRDDLFYRLSVIRIHLPPLRERIEDLPLLLEHFLTKHGKRHERRIRKIEPDALSKLSRYPWPGNVRELESVVESAFALGQEDTLTLHDLPDWLDQEARPISVSAPVANTAQAIPPTEGPPPVHPQHLPPLSLDEMEKDALTRALALAQGNKSKAAQLLGVSRKRLYRMLNDYHLSEDDKETE